MKKVVLVVLTVICPCFCFGQSWENVVKNDRQLLKVDFSSIQRTANTVSMWVKTIYSEKYIDYYIDKELKTAERIGYKISKKEYRGWHYTLTYETFYYGENKYSVSEIIQYRRDGSTIYRYKNEDITKNNIAPESLASALDEYFCKTYKFKMKNKTYNLYIEEIEDFTTKNPDAKFVE
jgi:hypothetical protein